MRESFLAPLPHGSWHARAPRGGAAGWRDRWPAEPRLYLPYRARRITSEPNPQELPMPRPVAAAPLFAALVFVWTLPAPMPARAEERAASQNWPRFRGPHGVGVMEGKPLPAKWDATTGEGIRWKAEIPGLAHSSPIVWGERVYL